MSDDKRSRPLQDIERVDTTPEVGDEGGTPGDLERGSGPQVGTGSEATELWRPADTGTTEVRRDETGPGRRSP